MLDHSGKVLIIGFGAVGESVLPLLLRHIRVDPAKIIIVDQVDRRRRLCEWTARGASFVHLKISRHNLNQFLSKHLSGGDLIIDLAWSVDCFDILLWARSHGVLYVNASLEEWDPYAGLRISTALEKSLYRRYVQMLDVARRWRGNPTAVLDHGMNPGIISSLVKKGLLDIAVHLLKKNNKASRAKKRALENHAEHKDWPRLAQELGVRVIHCSERDTQISARPKLAGEFVGMWSIEAMTEECIAPVEIGWGTHEKQLPPGAVFPDSGPRNQIILPQMGMNTWVRSWVPDEEFVGMVVTHGEAFTLSHYLTVRAERRVLYRPTVHYVYLPSNDTIASLHEFRCRGYRNRFRKRIVKDELETGADSVGALIMGHPFDSWWTGSVLRIGEARKLVPHQNATTIQVAIGVVAAAAWAVENPGCGVCLPEDLPYEHILRTAKPYLGDFVSTPVDWTPLTNYRIFFLDAPEVLADRKDVWQFKNFLFKP